MLRAYSLPPQGTCFPLEGQGHVFLCSRHRALTSLGDWGKKLQGRWVVVRRWKRRERGHPWLLLRWGWWRLGKGVIEKKILLQDALAALRSLSLTPMVVFGTDASKKQ